MNCKCIASKLMLYLLNLMTIIRVNVKSACLYKLNQKMKITSLHLNF